MLNGQNGGWIGVFLSVLMVFFGGGCERKVESSGEEVVYQANAQELTELSKNWLDAAKNLALSSQVGAVAVPKLQYAESAGCGLVYDFEVTTKTEQNGANKPVRARNQSRTEQVTGRFELLPDLEIESSTELPAWRLRGQQVGHYEVRNDIRLPGTESKDGEFPDVVLQNTGSTLQAVESESVLWSGLHAFGGLGELFPRLPVISTLESEEEEVVHGANVRVTEHLLINDVPAVVLSAAGEQFVGRFVVLNSGRLLHAAISRRVEGAAGLVRAQVAEARLTGACGDPILPPIGKKVSRVRRALDVYVGLVFAVHGDHEDRLGSYLSQDLVDAHGVETIMNMLKGHVGKYGIGVLGDPSLVDPVEFEGDFLRFRVVGRAEDSETGEVGTVVNHIIVEEDEGGMRVLSIGTTMNQVGKGADMLEISARRVYTDVGLVMP